jgi:hypothetical protein
MSEQSRFPLVMLISFGAACSGNSASSDLGPKRKLPCAEGQTTYVVVTSQMPGDVNIFAYDGTTEHFVGLARPGRTTLQLPAGARRAYVADMAGDQPIGNRTSLSAAVTFDYRCE